MAESTTVDGGCACSEIRFHFDRGDSPSAHHCHCRDCQRATGSAFATFAIVPDASFTVEGTPREWRVEGQSGGGVIRSFCGTCGSQLFSRVDVMPGMSFVKTGVMDDASWVEPVSSFWSSSAQRWCPVSADIPAHERNPG